MSPSTIDIRDIIKDTQEKMLRSLIDLVPREKRAEAERVLDQFWAASKALAAMSPGIDTRYSSAISVIDAIKLFLSDIDRPATLAEILVEFVKRGFRPRNAVHTAANINRSLWTYLQGRGVKKNQLKEINGRVGLAEWPDYRWPSEPVLTSAIRTKKIYSRANKFLSKAPAPSEKGIGKKEQLAERNRANK